ncbi:MAG: pseudaminic acid cytidylyltransferase [Proteobacteria bacterium]|nr:pseudaminic acid cytidylyltransferase [Pseudomonadota bacterium]MBU4296641.1 pseudaminic acid cytidylyltransferase [Pseudomonadota bacterium]MCG2748434.1 pseudaminic acid cytidylyltransferase [Desulfobulbaceae bacterium]
MKVAIIPARGGSKRIVGKNIKPFMGKPVIAYSIEAARLSGLFDRIIVSTDAEEIAAVAREFGAETPFVRPAALADDFATTAVVVEHAVRWLRERNDPVRYVCCIYATAPFIRPADLRAGYELLVGRGVSSVFPVTSYPSSIFRALKIAGDGHLVMMWPEHELTRSNDLPEAFHDAGQFYWLDAAAFLRNSRMYGEDALPVILPRHLVQDIDTPEDWLLAELMYEALARRGAGEGER